MQEQRLLKKKRKADSDGNKMTLTSVCIDLADIYIGQERYEDAIEEYKIVAQNYKNMGKPLDYGRANRCIGEAYVKLQQYDEALQYQQTYLNIAKEQKNKLEEQRALATIGHIHLTRYLDDVDNPTPNYLNLAYKAFKKSLVLCESLSDVKKHEHKDIIARLLANLGIVEECKGEYNNGVELLIKSVEICKSYDLFEQLYRGYTALSGLYVHKKMYDEAIKYCNLAFEVAGRLKNKKSLQGASLSSKGDVLIKLGDFHSAKNILLKAYKLKDPNSSNQQVIEQNLKVVAAMCKAEDALLTTASNDYKTKKTLYEKLGDGACRLKNFSTAIEYYHKMLEAANANNESGLDLSPCYISLAETYRDNKQFDMAIKYFREDYNILRDNFTDGINTLLNIAECMESNNSDVNDIDNTYNEALTVCKANVDRQMEYKVLLRYIPLLKKFHLDKCFKFEIRLEEIKHVASESESDLSPEQGIPNIGDDISINDITDFSDASDSENRPVRRRTKNFAIKKNNKGETQLHTACIKGNFELVKRLLDQGHPVNVRDNCGWLPIHEACINGHVDIVRMLIEKGAFIDDRGGTLCQGITPLHDAALNGHLEVIQLLLDNRASSIIKNDNGEIPLQVLKVWRTSIRLNDDQSKLYDVVAKRLTQDAEKLGLTLDGSITGDQSTIVKDENESLSNTSRKTRPRRKSQIGNLRRSVNFDDDLTETPKVPRFNSNVDPETPVQSEYKRVMENLRHPSREECEKKRKSNEKVSAHVVVDLDDWLDDDIGLMNKKRRTGAVDGFLSSTKMRRTQSGSSFARHSSSTSLKSVISNQDDSDNTSDFFELLENRSSSDDDIPMASSNSIAKCSFSKKPKKKRQTSLMDSGFSRHRSFSPTTSIASRNSWSPGKQARLNSSTVSVDMNNIFNTEPMLSVDVRITGKLYKVPVPASEIHTRTIKWLGDEAAKRYSRKECMKPDLELETKNGAILADEDLISVLFSAGITHAEEVQARITKCNVLPLAERYSEACALENITPPKELVRVLEETFTSLNLTDLNLRSRNIAPLCKVINRQTNLHSLNLSGNFIHDDCFQLLCTSLPMLDNLTEINLSSNQLTFASLQQFSETFVHSPKSILPNLTKLDLSHNPLGNNSLNYLAIITRFLKLKTLILVDVNFTTNFDANFELLLDSVVHFDVSFNRLSNRDLFIIVSWLKPYTIETLDISSNTGTSDGLIKEILQWLQPSGDTKLPLKSLNFSRTRITDSDVFDLLRILRSTYQFKSLDLSYNSNLTSLSLRRLVQNYPSFDHLKLIGCENIFKYFMECTDKTWSCVQLKDLEISCDFATFFVEKNCIVDMWKDLYENKAVIFELPNFVKLSVRE